MVKKLLIISYFYGKISLILNTWNNGAIMKKFVSVMAALLAASIFTCTAGASGFPEASVYQAPYAPSIDFIGGACVNELPEVDSCPQAPMLFSAREPEVSLEEHMRAQIIEHKETVDVSQYNITSSYFVSIYNAFVFMNSDLPIYTGCSSIEEENGIMISFKPYYIYSTKAESDEKTAVLDALTSSIADYASAGITDEEKLLFAFDKIAADYYYTPGTEADFTHKNRTAYGLMEDGHGVCQGYAIMYSIVLNKLGIENYLCNNNNPSVNHIWNCVKLGENWYHSDPTSAETTDESIIIHKFLLLSDSAMLEYGNHGVKADWKIQKPNASLPECDSTKYESDYLFNVYNVPFYRQNGALEFTVSLPTDTTIDMKIKSQSLSPTGLLLSEPVTHQGSTNIYLLTSWAYKSPFKVIGALYDSTDRYNSCTCLPANSIGGGLYMALPVPANSSGMTLKYFITGGDYITPLGLTSQMNID